MNPAVSANSGPAEVHLPHVPAPRRRSVMPEGWGPATLRPHYLYVGTLFVSSTPHLVTTVLGTCVSVCLWDRLKHIGGINHYMLPRWTGEDPASCRFGDVAIAQLFERMERLQSRRSDLVAKVFGGKRGEAETPGSARIGERNVRLALKALADAGIPVVAQNVGGTCGRKLLFNTATGEVLLKRLAAGCDSLLRRLR